jgi:hypothetical protein
MAELSGNGCNIAQYADGSSVLENGKLSQRCYESIPVTRIEEAVCNRLQLSTEALG